MSGALLGIDIGTTALKAAAYDARTGRLLASAGARLALKTAPDGRREQSAAGIVASLRAAVRAVTSDLARGCRVRGIGLAAQGGSGAICAPDGRALTPVHLWNDLRFMPHLEALRRERPAAFWREWTWRDEPGWGLARLRWLRERGALPESPWLYVGVGEIAHHALTSQWRQDPCNALQIGCLNVPARALDASLMSLSGAGLSAVAPLRVGHGTQPLSATAARALGLDAGLSVAGPYMDHEAGSLSTGGSPEVMQVSLGTAWVANFAMPRDARWRSPFQLVIPAADGGDDWLVIQPLLTGNVTWDWATRTLMHPRPSRALALADAALRTSLLPAAGLVAIPWLNMPSPLAAGSLGALAWAGASPATNRGELLRAVALGMACELRRVIDAALSDGRIERIVLGGGAARSAPLAALLAAALAPTRVRVAIDPDGAGTRGALHAFSPRASRAADRPLPRPSPRLAAEVARRLDLYRAALARLYGDVAAGGALAIDPGGRP